MRTANVMGYGEVEILSRKSGWVTFKDKEGVTRKARSSKILGPERAEGNDTGRKGAKKRRKTVVDLTGSKPSGRRIGSNPIVHFDRYQSHKTAGGNISYDCGDPIAVKLRDMSLDEVYRECARVLKNSGREKGTIGEIEKGLRERYGHLNAGMQRMNLGNKIRATH